VLVLARVQAGPAPDGATDRALVDVYGVMDLPALGLHVAMASVAPALSAAAPPALCAQRNILDRGAGRPVDNRVLALTPRSFDPLDETKLSLLGDRGLLAMRYTALHRASHVPHAQLTHSPPRACPRATAACAASSGRRGRASRPGRAHAGGLTRWRFVVPATCVHTIVSETQLHLLTLRESSMRALMGAHYARSQPTQSSLSISRGRRLRTIHASTTRIALTCLPC
jgi:hypothetical protein